MTAKLDLAQFEGHTPGPWHVGGVKSSRNPAYPVRDHKEQYVAAVEIHARGGSHKDADLIAAAPALLAECRRLQAENETLLEALETVRCVADSEKDETHDEAVNAIVQMGHIARAALKGAE